MKSLKTILTMGLLLVSTTSFAQFANGGNSSNGSNGGGLVKKTDNYSRIYVGYNPIPLHMILKELMTLLTLALPSVSLRASI